MAIRPLPVLFFLSLSLAAQALEAKAPPVEPTPVQAGALTLSEAVRFAYDNAPALLSARLAQENSVRDERNAMYRLFPTLGFTSQHGLAGPNKSTQGSRIVTDPDYGPYVQSYVIPPNMRRSQYELKLNSTLYDNGQTWTNWSVARASRTLADSTYRQAVEGQALEIAKAFYNHSYLLRSLEAREAQKKALDLQYRSAEVQFRRGMRTQQDVLRFKVQSMRAESDVTTGRREIEKSARTLFALVGREVSSDPSIDWMTLVKPVDLEKVPTLPKDSGLMANDALSVKLARQQADVAREQLPLSRRTLFPEGNLGASVGYQDSSYWGRDSRVQPTALKDRWGWQVGVQVNYTLWDWNIRSRSHANEVAKLATAEIAARKALDAAQAKLANLRADLDRIAALCRETEELRRLEQTNYENIAAEYRYGRATYLDLTEGLKSLLSARLEYYGAVRDLLQTLAEYRSEEGKLYESLVL